MKLLYVITLALLMSGCQNDKEVTETIKVYDRVDHWWPKKDEYVERTVAVVKDEHLAEVPHESQKVYKKENDRYIPANINVLPPTFQEYMEKDKSQTRELVRTIAARWLRISLVMAAVAAIAAFKFRVSLDWLAMSIISSACSVTVLYKTTLVLHACVVLAVSLVVFIVYSTVRKHIDESKKKALKTENDELVSAKEELIAMKKKLEDSVKELVASGEKMKLFDKWTKDEKDQVLKIQSPHTVDLVKKHQESISNDQAS